MSGVDPAMFSQALMYHASRYSKDSWAGEPETDPTLDEEDHTVEGWELSPQQCLDLAYGGVMRERSVLCGASLFLSTLEVKMGRLTVELVGSSTACIMSLNSSSGMLKAAK